MTNKKPEDLEEDLEVEEEQEEEQEDSSEEDAAGKSKKEAEDHSEEGSSEEEDGEAVKKQQETEEEREEIRARRRRERKMKRERERRDRMTMQNTIVELQNQNKALTSEFNKFKSGMTENDLARIDNEINELKNIYQQANQKMEESITSQDGASFTKAKQIADQAWQRASALELSKKQRKQQAEESGHTTKNDQRTTQPQAVIRTNEGQQMGLNFMRENSDWYKMNQQGQPLNLDSMIVTQLDSELYDEGYDPDTSEYWDELRSRVKERLPHRFKHQQSQNKRPKVVTGGSGNESRGNPAGESSLPKEFVDTLKQAGYWDNPVKRKAAIANYRKNKGMKG